MQSFPWPRTLAAAAVLGALAVPISARAQDTPAPERPRRNPGVPGAVPVAPLADLPAEPFTVSPATTVLTKHLVDSRPTIFVFTKPSSTLERRFVQQVCRDAGRKAGVGVVNLTTGSEPAAVKFEVKETPTALVFDRRGRFVARSTDPDQIRASIQQAVGVMRIDWPAPDDPRYEAANQKLGRPVTGGILRTMAFQPEWLAYINDLSRKAHFSPGFLDVRTKEMIAAYVSALNDCRF
jgi:hypothetical protein